jgi:hypothetical protein
VKIFQKYKLLGDEPFAPWDRSEVYFRSAAATKLRSQMVINTYAETAPFQDPADLGLPGPDLIDIA